MEGFTDRRPARVVPKVELRSQEALSAHLVSHHMGFGAEGDWTHSELRESHQEFHEGRDYIHSQPHNHGRNVNP